MRYLTFDRENRLTSGLEESMFPEAPPGTLYPRLCGAANVVPVRDRARSEVPSLLLSRSFGLNYRDFESRAGVKAGWVRISSDRSDRMVSLPGSIAYDSASGMVRTGEHQYFGLPMLSFSARSFENGTLQCSAGDCQGNYGGAFPAATRRDVR